MDKGTSVRHFWFCCPRWSKGTSPSPRFCSPKQGPGKSPSWGQGCWMLRLCSSAEPWEQQLHVYKHSTICSIDLPDPQVKNSPSSRGGCLLLIPLERAGSAFSRTSWRSAREQETCAAEEAGHSRSWNGRADSRLPQASARPSHRRCTGATWPFYPQAGSIPCRQLFLVGQKCRKIQ